ncbi:MAG: sensor histidine kinase [Candidatus Omnitrophica bacterium]|nr:sensor histidine kinase [Candidatus Omnitrophota bacterium]
MLTFKEYCFDPGAMSIVQLGEELIGHPTTALNELVKNAYDADATECTVYIHYAHELKQSFLIIHDSGLGMKEEVLFGEWLRPSVSNKRKGNRKSEVFERNYLGSKGIGRLAAMALGEHVTIITRVSKDDSYNWLSLHRADFRKDLLLSEIKFPGGKIAKFQELFSDPVLLKSKGLTQGNNTLGEILSKTPLNSFREGTLIIIEVLDDSIRTIIDDEFTNQSNKIEDTSIMRALKSLVTPLELNNQIQNELLKNEVIEKKKNIAKASSTFSIFFGSNLISKEEGDKLELILVEPAPILKSFDYRFAGKVTDSGEVEGFYVCKRLTEDSFDEKIKLDKDFVFSEEVERKRKVEEIESIPEEVVNAKAGEFFFDIRIYDRDLDAIEKMSKILKAAGKTETRQMMDEFLGLRISKNGFGIKPYGEENKDWMDLGQLRVQNPASVVSTNQILGYIFLYSPENDGLSEKTNREGFFENKAFITFKKILRAVLLEIGRRRYNYRLKHNLGRIIKSKFDLPDTSGYLDYIKNKTRDKDVIKKSLVFVKGITTALDNMESSLTFSQRLASLGSGLELVYHELAQPITHLGSSKSLVELLAQKVNDEKLRDKFIHEVSCLGSAISTLDTLKDSLKPAIGLARPKLFRPVETFKKVCFLFSKDVGEKEIKIEADKAMDGYEINDYEYALWISFLNIVNNAVYWLKFIESGRKIFLGREKKDIFVIGNTGPKIPEDALERIFEYGVTMKKEKNATGLGLSFTRSILSKNNWDIWAENKSYGPAFFIKKVK